MVVFGHLLHSPYEAWCYHHIDSSVVKCEVLSLRLIVIYSIPSMIVRSSYFLLRRLANFVDTPALRIILICVEHSISPKSKFSLMNMYLLPARKFDPSKMQMGIRISTSL